MTRDPRFDLKPYLAARAGEIEAHLDRLLPDRPVRLVRAMRHSLMGGGKRVRPVLCMAAAAAVSGRAGDAVRQAACAIEMIHTYSLIHDDLPAMDDDTLRRGKPTCHTAFDEATAILAGDALLTLAFQVLSTLPPTEGMRVIGMVSRAAGHQGMIEGQMQDMAAEGSLLDIEALAGMHRLKTGGLIRAAVGTGALLAGAPPEAADHLDRYAGNIGLAFQVTDDLLNVDGDPAVLGKAVGTDRMRGKNTYPGLLGIDRSRTLAETLVAEALQALDDFDHRADPLRAIARYIIDRNR